MTRSSAPLQRALRAASVFGIAALLAAIAGIVWPAAAPTLNVVAGALLLAFVTIVIVGLARRAERPSN